MENNQLIGLLEELKAELMRIPIIDFGKEYFVEKGWQTVTFNTDFEMPPSVLAIIEAPEGWSFDQYPFTPPDIDLDKIETAAVAFLDTFDVKIDFPDPLADGKKYATWLADEFKEAADKYLNEDNFKIGGIDFTGVRDNVISLVYRVGELIGTLIEKFVFQYIKERILEFRDKVKGKINKILSDIRQKIKDAFSDAAGKIQEVLDKFSGAVQDTLIVLATYTNDALNLSPEKLYDMWGLEKGTLCVPAMVKQGSVTNTQFTVWAPGPSTCHWCAFGEFAAPGAPVIMKLETLIEQL